MFRASRSLATGFRNLSTKAVSHAPPIKIHGTIGRYAEAVYTAASKIGALEKVEGELQAFSVVLKKSPGFAAFLENPTIARSEKSSKIGAILEEGKVTHITRNLFLVLAANGRIGNSSKVISSYEDLMQAKRGVVHATIISAEPLKKKNLDSVKAAVMSMVGNSKQVDLKVEVDERILGGLQVIVGDKFLDLSVSSRVSDLSKSLESAL